MTGSPFERTMTYAGLSSMHVTKSAQKLSLCLDQSSKVKANFTIEDKVVVMGLREAFTSVLYNFRKNFNYSPSNTVSSNGDLQEQFDKLGKSYSEQNACSEHQELMKFMDEHDPESFVQPDATVSVTNDGVLWELFSKKATLGASIHLKEGFTKKGKWTNGSSSCDTSLGFLYSLAKMSMNSLEVSIEKKPQLSDGYKADGTYTKTERIPSYWSRTWLQLQGYFHDEKPYAVLNRMEAYNLIRFLRLNRPGKIISGRQRSLKLQLEDGKPPIITINTFRDRKLHISEKLVCDSSFHDGASVQVETWETDMFWFFEPLLPYLQSLKIMVGGTAQPIVIEGDCGAFTLSISSLGVSASNWTRVMQMDTYLDRRGLSQKKDTKSQIQKGLTYYDPFSKTQINRSLLDGLDLDSITFRDDAERKAYDLVYVPKDDLEYSRFNLAVSKMRRYQNMPSSLTDIEKLSTKIEQTILDIATNVGLDGFVVKGFYSYMSKYISAIAEILEEDEANVDVFLYDIESTLKNRHIKKNLTEYLHGIVHKRKENCQEGLLDKLAQKLSTRKIFVSAIQLKELLHEVPEMKIEGNSQFTSIQILHELKNVLVQSKSVPAKTCKELLGSKAVLIQKEVTSDKYIHFTDCIVQDGHVAQKPRFSMAPYYKDGGCTCTKPEGETICVHHKAVWLQHCIDEKSLKEAQKSDPSLVVVQKIDFVELTDIGEKSHSVEQYYHQITIENNGRLTKRIFNDVQTAGLAFAHQIETYHIKGFLQAGE
jgi:hypothetical protein